MVYYLCNFGILEDAPTFLVLLSPKEVYPKSELSKDIQKMGKERKDIEVFETRRMPKDKVQTKEEFLQSNLDGGISTIIRL